MRFFVRALTIAALVLAASSLLSKPAFACTQPWSATWIGQSAWPTLDAGQRTTLYLRYRNDGCNTWNINQVGSQALLGTNDTDPGVNKWSWLGGATGCGVQSGWYACDRIRPANDVVAPGATVDFFFEVVAPAAPGTYKLNVRPVIEGVIWMEDVGAFMQVAVRATQGPSRYMKTVDARIPNVPPGTPAGVLYIEGCKAGGDTAAVYGGPYTPQTGVIVLDFGAAAISGTTQGATMFNLVFASTTEVLEAGKAFAQGYWDCSTTIPTVKIALGTSNNSPNTTSAHGVAWAQMAKSFNDYIAFRVWTAQLGGRAGIDLELAWGSSTAAKNWVCVWNVGTGTCTDGYGSVTGNVPYYDFGDASDCPPVGACEPTWTSEAVWFVSWGAPNAWPLPEIYNTAGAQAQQWKALSLYAKNSHGIPMTILGPMTQWTACQSNPPCVGVDNTPQAGWLQLWKELNGDINIHQELNYSTDITWAN